MNNKFEIGDIVQRIEGEHVRMRVGNIGTVIKIASHGGLVLKEFHLRVQNGVTEEIIHDESCFTLISRVDDLDTVIINIRKEIHGR